MENYKKDAENYIRILKAFNTLQDNEHDRAYKIFNQALAQFERWSFILYDIKKNETKENKNPALKGRIEDVMKILSNIHTGARMVWSKAKDDIKKY